MWHLHKKAKSGEWSTDGEFVTAGEAARRIAELECLGADGLNLQTYLDLSASDEEAFCCFSYTGDTTIYCIKREHRAHSP